MLISIKSSGVCSYVQKHVIEALEGFSKFLRTKLDTYETFCLLLFFSVFKTCNIVLPDASAANIGSNSLALTVSIFTISTYMGIVIVNSGLCRKLVNVYIDFLC